MIQLPRILVIEDDRLLLSALRLSLTHEGYRVIEASNGLNGLELARKEKPDFIILDVELPGLSGLEVCRELRRLHFDSPILMLTGRDQVKDKVIGLNAGADDYLAKPFELSELRARIEALLRREKRTLRQATLLEFGLIRVDLANRSATRGGEVLGLTRTEFSLLELLGQNAGQVVSRETILDVVWGYARFPSTRTIDTHIWRLRRKIGDTAEHPRWIKHVHGQGYLLAADAVVAP